MAINQEKKSNRLLGNRRFTSADLNTSQEAFSNVNDLNAGEIYTQQDLIPESGLPFSGSSQDGQQNNFISPKYSISSLANANTEDVTSKEPVIVKPVLSVLPTY